MIFEFTVPNIGSTVKYWTCNYQVPKEGKIIAYKQTKYKIKVLLELEDNSRVWKNVQNDLIQQGE